MAPRVIQVPKTPLESYNPNRPASTLLQSQAVHLHEALQLHEAEVRAVLAIDPKQLQTESAVSEYARKVARILHPHVVKRQGK
jgi:hypothetical protein